MRLDRMKLPEGWKVDLLDKIATRGSGHTPDKKISSYWNGGIKWVSLADSSKLDKVFISETENEISEQGIKNSSAVLHVAGTVILSRDAGVGKSAIISSDMAVSQHFIAWECSGKGILNNLYLYYCLQMLKPEFERIAVGSTIKTIGLPYFKKLKISFPPILEQEKIAKVVSTWDEAIKKIDQLIYKKNKFYNVNLNALCNNRDDYHWEGEIREIATGYNGLSGKCKDDFLPTGKPFISYNNVFRNSRIDRNMMGRVCIAEGEHQNIVRYGDIIFTGSSETIGDVGMCSVVLDQLDETYLNSFCFGIRLNDFQVLTPEYARFYFRSMDMRRKITKLGQGSTRFNLSRERLINIKVKLPTIEMQVLISKALQAQESEIRILLQIKKSFMSQKEGLMNQLLLGKKRLSVKHT